MPPRASLKAFLATARAALTAPPSKCPAPLTFVVGNESADLDSLCSALLLAYFHTYIPPQKQGSTRDGVSGIPSTLHIPVCHLRRADLSLRPEFAAVLRDADIGSEDVFTLEDMLTGHNGGKYSKSPAEVAVGDIHPEDTRWLLVDHNAMTGSLASVFASRVFGCVDHHADENVIPRDAEIRIIEKTGSCMSLVLERCSEAWNGHPGESNKNGLTLDDAKADAQLARLALAPVLIDTSDLGDANKTTACDKQAVAIAEAKIAAYEDLLDDDGGERYDRTSFYKRILSLKEDLSEMSLRDILRKDYKEWDVPGGLNLGTSAVPRGFGYLLKEKTKAEDGKRGPDGQPGGNPSVLVDAIGDWGVEKDGCVGAGEMMDLVVVLTGFQDDEGHFKRELLVWARSEAGVKAAKRFEETYRDPLRLDTWGDGVLDSAEDGPTGWRRCWAQGAVEHSRKQIAPMLRDALAGVADQG